MMCIAAFPEYPCCPPVTTNYHYSIGRKELVDGLAQTCSEGRDLRVSFKPRFGRVAATLLLVPNGLLSDISSLA